MKNHFLGKLGNDSKKSAKNSLFVNILYAVLFLKIGLLDFAISFSLSILGLALEKSIQKSERFKKQLGVSERANDRF